MTFQPKPGATLSIEEKIYRIAEHPLAPGMPYGQEGRRAMVYQLLAVDEEKYALKVFKSRFRIPRMVVVSETLKPYGVLEGLQACERVVITASRHRKLLSQHPDLAYAVLMPWVDGQTWQEILLSDEPLSSERSLRIAQTFANLMVRLEERGLAHSDLSGPNLIIQLDEMPALVDLEEMYGPDFLKPESLPAGSPGYAHKSAPRGLWNAYSDRFAGVVLLVEMLCCFDPKVRKAAWGESYFSPQDMQNENQRLNVIRESLKNHYRKRILDLFNQAWRSDSLRDCPTFAEWAVAVPEEVKVKKQVEDSQTRDYIPKQDDAFSIYLNAQKAADQGYIDRALSLYRKAIALVPPELSVEIEKQIKSLEDRVQDQEGISEKEGITQEKKDTEQYSARPCPVCDGLIPRGQQICPQCEGIPGEKKDEVHLPVPEPDQPPGNVSSPLLKHWGTWIILVGIAVVVLGLALGIRPGAEEEPAEGTPTYERALAGEFATTPTAPEEEEISLGTEAEPVKVLFVPSVDVDFMIASGDLIEQALNEATGLFFEVSVPTSYAATIEEMCASPTDTIGFIPAMGYALANQLCGVEPGLASERYGWNVYWTMFVVARDSDFQTLADLEGATWAYPDATFTSSFLYPTSLFSDQGITIGETVETGGHPQSVRAVYLGEVDFATTYFSAPLLPEGSWTVDMAPDIPNELIEDCGLTEEGKLYCGDYRVLDARATITDEAPDVVQKVRILALSPEIPNDTMSFSPDFPNELKQIIIDAVTAYVASDACAETLCNESFYDWTGVGPILDENFDGIRIMMEAQGIKLENIGE